MPGMIAERDRRAVVGADAALRAEDQEFRRPSSARLPAHAGILRQAEEIAAGPFGSISAESGSGRPARRRASSHRVARHRRRAFHRGKLSHV